MSLFSKQLRKASGRIFNRIRKSSGGDGDHSHNNNYNSNKVVSFIRVLVTKDEDVPEAAAAWAANEEEILSEQGPHSIRKNLAVFLLKKCREFVSGFLTQSNEIKKESQSIVEARASSKCFPIESYPRSAASS